MLGTNSDLEDSLQAELELIFRAQRNKRLIDRERDFSVFRSGSAPPTVEGSRSAVDSLLRSSNFGVVNGNVGLSEDEIWSHPAYLSYNYSHDHVNPPLLPKEHWRVAQRFHGGGCSGGGGNSVGPVGKLRRNKLVGDGSSSSLFSVQPGFSVQNVEEDDLRLSGANASNLFERASSEWLDRGLNGKAGLQTSGLGTRRKSFADILQVGLDQPASLHLPRLASYNAFGDIAETCIIDSNLSELCNTMGPLEGLSSRTASPGLVGSLGNPGSHAFASGLGILSSTAPDNQLVSISPCSGLPMVGNGNGATMQNGHSSSVMALDEIAATLCSLRLPEVTHADLGNCIQAKLNSNLDNHPNLICNLDDFGQKTLQQQLTGKSTPDYLSFSTKYADVARVNGAVQNHNALEVGSAGEPRVPRKSFSSANLLSKAQPLGLGNWERSILQDQNAIARSAEFVGRLPRSHSFNQKLNSAIMNHLDEGICETGRSWNSFANQGGNDLQLSAMDPYLGRTSDYATHAAATSCVPHIKNHLGNPSGDVDGIWNAYLKVLLAQQTQLYELSLLEKSSGLDPGHPRNPSYGRDMPCLRSSMRSPSESGGFSNDQVMAFSSKMRNSGGPTGTWQSDVGITVEKRKVSSLLDEFKINKARSFELSDIVGHVVEFSTDQYGSRFIQQKLETAAVDEKEKIFPEIIPLARTLMTDVFGNYVIQKFFEHGPRSQRAELASQLTGHMLPLSLQMYGCRVIQKALEVVDVDEQTQMVAELDGSVMKCVRDQNGNHVIQKCIECVPEDRIQFIISAFYGQVASLSAHPYGCRVIQRILEHCEDTHTHQIIMDEILQSLCTLAEDQYGNYVIQHVLEHGKPHEKIAIIRKLAGQIVRMSQQKFASNVVEKCLTYGGPEEHQLLVNEMLGSTDENEPLQVMMKDPFGNYVVQKVLETCSDQNLELILSRIKVHLNVLKRYTYGKHIVSRVEKLILTGERLIGQSSSVSS